MTRLLYVFICVIASQIQLTAQASLNDYKYIIVPKQFDFLNAQDQYQTSSLTKFLFNKHGYTVFFDDDDLPQDLSENRCLGLKSDIKKIKGFLITKLQIDLVDCKGNVVISSAIGETKVKEYQKAYQIAIREAFVTYQFFDYKYVPSISAKSIDTNTSNLDEIARLKMEVEALKGNKGNVVPIPEVKALELNESSKTKNGDLNQAAKGLLGVEVLASTSVKEDMLYAQPITNGFQIVDTQPKKVMILLDTGTPDVFIVKGEDSIVYKKEGFWVYAVNSGENLQLSVLNLKF
jgi:hypothetical protein